MQLLPTLLSISGRKCLVAGTSPVAMQYVHALQASGALILHISAGEPVNTQSQPATADVKPQLREFVDGDLDDCWLAIAATGNAQTNETIKKACDARHLFCNVISDTRTSSCLIDVSAPPAILAANYGQHTATYSGGNGFVSLVGAGPGDPELLTLKALRLIQSADVIVHDRLVSTQIIALCRPDAEFIYAGKAKSSHAIPQHSINQLLVDLALQKRHVVRLKGGDPFIFGRGGEEIETLSDQQVPFEVVPGITAASGCASFAGIPLTHRDHAQSCVFVTGHLKDGQINLNWQDLRDPSQTIVVYMGLTGVQMICDSLIRHGRSEDTPAALIEQGTTQDQRVLCSTLAGLPARVAGEQVVAPTLLIIGGVVSLRDKLNWFGTA